MKTPPVWLLALMALAIMALAWIMLQMLTRDEAEAQGDDLSRPQLGPCWFCGAQGAWCPACGVYKCAEHGGPLWSAIGAAAKAAGAPGRQEASP